MQFNGAYERILDSKKRIIMPPKLREMWGEKELVLFSNPKDQYIRVYKVEDWEAIAEQNLFKNDGIDRSKEQRAFFLNSESCEMDAQGRFVLPNRFIERAGIERDIVITGLGKRIEIWAKERFDAEVNPDESDIGFTMPW